MNELKVTGKQEFMGKEIPVVLGGFGKDKKCICDKAIADIHSMESKNIRARITDNIKRFQKNVDVIDLKQGAYQASTSELLEQLGYSKQQITQAQHIYLLSERGYAKLIKIMDSDLAWEIHDKLIDEYFQLREEKKQQIKNESLASVNNAVKILTPLLEKAGCNSKIMLLTAKSLYEKAGVALPIEIEEEKKFYDTKYIAKQCRMFTKSNKPAFQAVAMIIKKLELKEGQYVDTWETNGKWQGTVRKYDDDVISMVKAWLRENDYPESIFYEQYDGEVKQYHVIYKDIVEVA